MNHLWPVFHDPAYQPSLRERLSFHWQANLRMLRCPRDMVLFTLISFAPLALLYGFMTLFPGLYTATSTGGANPTIDMAPLMFTTVVTFMVFLVLQHLAFVLAMNLTYIHHVRAELGARGVPVCPRCANLLPPHTPGAACPECGATRQSATMPDSDRMGSSNDPEVHDSEVSSR